MLGDLVMRWTTKVLGSWWQVSGTVAGPSVGVVDQRGRDNDGEIARYHE
jgi:hypothetical protein